MNPNADYEWDWFDQHDSYGVRRGTEVHCLTSRTKAGYERAVTIAAALNRAQIDGSGAS